MQQIRILIIELIEGGNPGETLYQVVGKGLLEYIKLFGQHSDGQKFRRIPGGVNVFGFFRKDFFEPIDRTLLLKGKEDIP
jgi:hypothetical protein